MGQISPARQLPLPDGLKTSKPENAPPLIFKLKRAGASSAFPLQIVGPTDQSIPPARRIIFVYDR